ncbi:MAG TPA: hypothetical protein VNM14_07475 [Planctomycetota bacterium]|jgi:hypothetical protein|nr:hypothetical protein [Planctomycetota bacterium]
MDMKCLMSTFARQINAVTIHAGFERRLVPSDRGPIESILRSLRLTYLALSTGLDPRKDARHLFILNVSASGDYVLTQDGAAVPVNPPYLTYLFWSAGVDLLPGQFVFVEPDVAKLAIEEALGRVALEQAFAEREWVTRRTAMEVSAVLPRREDLDALHGLETRANLLWDQKIELVAASLIADEFLERASPEAA